MTILLVLVGLALLSALTALTLTLTALVALALTALAALIRLIWHGVLLSAGERAAKRMPAAIARQDHRREGFFRIDRRSR